MSGAMTVAAMLRNLGEQIAVHRAEEARHAEREAHHREERARHAGELERLSTRFAALEAAAGEAEEVLLPLGASAVPALRDEDLGDKPTANRALAHVLKSWPLDVPFTPSEFAAELNRRLGGKVRRKVDARAASNFLRRRRYEGIIHTVQEGASHREAVYRRRQ
jgi:hypothetical protein